MTVIGGGSINNVNGKIKNYQWVLLVIFTLIIPAGSGIVLSYNRNQNTVKEKYFSLIKSSHLNFNLKIENYLKNSLDILKVLHDYTKDYKKLYHTQHSRFAENRMRELLKIYSAQSNVLFTMSRNGKIINASHKSKVKISGRMFQRIKKQDDLKSTCFLCRRPNIYIARKRKINGNTVYTFIQIDNQSMFEQVLKNMKKAKIQHYILNKKINGYNVYGHENKFSNFLKKQSEDFIENIIMPAKLKESIKSIFFKKYNKKKFYYLTTWLKKYRVSLLTILPQKVIDEEIKHTFGKRFVKTAIPMLFVAVLIFLFVARFLRKIYGKLENQNLRLSKALDDAKIANSVKTRFLAVVSHELRTPLNAILGFSELLQLEKGLNQEQREDVDYIYRSAVLLAKIVEDILQMTVLETGKVEVHYSGFDLKLLISELKSLFIKQIQEKGLDFKIDVHENMKIIYSDENKIRQIILNLVSNAIKFTEDGGITVSAKKQRGVCIISVADTGSGIKKYNLDKIFEDFTQLGSILERAQGTGLGLSICKKLVELLGGQIWVESKYGKGSTFYFTIPYKNNG